MLMLFMLSAMAPEVHAVCFKWAATLLKPGGRLLFRDYAAGDAAQRRFKAGNQVQGRLFVRKDGTLSYFFTHSELEALAEGAGLQTHSLRRVERQVTNRAEGNTMHRVFTTAEFVKPHPQPKQPRQTVELLG